MNVASRVLDFVARIWFMPMIPGLMLRRKISVVSLISILLIVPGILVAQSYPGWFLRQEGMKCPMTAVGYAVPSFYRDSSIAQATRNAAENVGRQTATHVQGGQVFWATEGGTYLMGADFREQYDTGASKSALSSLVPVDTFVTSSIALVLLSDSGCQVDRRILGRLADEVEGPAWTETLPLDAKYTYAVGVAPEYYYEVSSWLEAERSARRNLARSVVTEIKSLQKLSAREGQELRSEELSVSLHHIEAVARWRDMEKKIFYVLLRAPKQENMR
jgi:hypothetical protein